MPGKQSKPDDWSAEDKLAVIIETASLNEIQLGKYCRNKGLYPERVNQWKASALFGYQHSEKTKQDKTLRSQQDKKKTKRLESELRRKEKALAETAALLVLSKKCEAIWGVNEED